MRNDEMYLQLYLVRHAESLGNIETDEVFEHINPPLSPHGKEQVKALHERFKNFENFTLYSSPLTRAIETAKAISDNIIIDNDLPEQGTRVIDGGYDGWEETFEEAYERANRVLKKIKEKHHNHENVVLVSHAGFISVLIKAALNLDNTFRIAIYNTAVSKINFCKTQLPKLALQNDTSHLKETDGERLFWM